MNYQSARIFLAIVEHESITAAAKALYITQPAISSHMNRLEEELGVQLMIRKRGANKIVLTPEGTAFIPVAREWASAEQALQNYKETYQQLSFRIGAISSTHEYLIPTLTEKLKKELPQLDIQLYIIPDNEMELMFHPPHFDVALRFYDYKSIENTQYCYKIPFFQDHRYILCPADTPLPDRLLTPEDLDPVFEIRRAYLSEHMVFWYQQHFPENAMSQYPANIHILKIPSQFKDPRCWAFVHAHIAEHLIAEYPGELTFRRISPSPPARTGNLIVSKTFAKPEILNAFLRCCREYLKNHPDLISLLPDIV